MTKINRRDYLKRMGVAAGAIAAAPRLELFAQEHGANGGSVRKAIHDHSNRTIEDPKDPLVWKPKVEWPELPTRPCVKIIFRGLMGFSPRPIAGGPTYCDIGFHLKDQSNHKHRLSIYAYQIQGSRCKPELARKDLKGVKFELIIDKPDTEFLGPGVAFYQPGGAVTERRKLAHKNDFRWIVDFESNYLYGKYLKTLEKNKSVYNPTVSIKNGLFYTIRKTVSTFRAQTRDGNLVSDMGNIADVIGANIYLAEGGTVTLKVAGSEPKTLQAPAEVYLINHCRKDSVNHSVNPCEANPYDLEDKKARSDFFLNYKAFELNGMREYELFLAETYGNPEVPQGIICRSDDFIVTEEKKLHDRAPCAGVGYGGSNGLT
jgi:hypothetical protein